MAKRGLFKSTLLTISCMVGAGILVVKLMQFKFCGLLGWVFASLCSLAMGEIFAINAVSTEKTETIPEAVSATLGASAGFKVAVMQVLYMSIAVAVVADTMLTYVVDLIPIEYSGFNAVVMSIITLSIFTLVTTCGASDIIATIVTLVKVVFFGLTSLAGIFTLSRAKFFYVQSVSSSIFRGWPEIAAIACCIIIPMIISIWTSSEWNRRIRVGFTICLGLFLFFANMDLFRQGLAHSGNTYIKIFKSITCASTKALFAYAGLEFAAANPNDVKNPQVNVPRSTRLGIICASFIFISTYLMIVNILPIDKIVEKPLQFALCELVTQVIKHFLPGISQAALGQIQIVVVKIISSVAVLGCLGTCLAIHGATAKLLSKLFCDIANVKAKPPSLDVISLLVTTVVILLLWFGFWKNEEIIGNLIAFGILYTYFYGVLVGVRRSNNFMLNSFGILGCAILALGCAPEAVFVGTLVHFMADTILAISLKYSSKTDR